MTCDLTLYQYSAELAGRIEWSLDGFNKDRNSQDGCYVMSLPTSQRPYCGLWRLFPGKVLVYVRTLGVGMEIALDRAMKMLQYCNLKLNIEPPSFFEKSYGSTVDIVPFGKYRGKRMAEIFYVDPAYVLWLAEKYTPESRQTELLVELARYFVKINFELKAPKRKTGAASEFVGEEGEKLQELSLIVLSVRLQVDTYKPDFYVDQRVMAIDRRGNRFTFLIKAAGKSQTPKALHCRSRRVFPKEELVLKSARVMGHYESGGMRYTRLGYVKYQTPVS